MKTTANTIAEYIAEIPEDRREAINKLIDIFSKNLTEGFTKTFSYGMIGFVVPHTLYPNGYHCDPKLPLPSINIASQKNFVAIYHMGIYAKPELLEWFVTEYPKHCSTKLDMGKSCIRFKKVKQILYELLADLAQKMTVQDWVETYEQNYKK